MAPNVQDHVVDEVKTRDNGNTDRNPAEHHAFHTIEHIGKPRDSSHSKQRIAASAIALLICTAIYGVFYLAMH